MDNKIKKAIETTFSACEMEIIYHMLENPHIVYAKVEENMIKASVLIEQPFLSYPLLQAVTYDVPSGADETITPVGRDWVFDKVSEFYRNGIFIAATNDGFLKLYQQLLGWLAEYREEMKNKISAFDLKPGQIVRYTNRNDENDQGVLKVVGIMQAPRAGPDLSCTQIELAREGYALVQERDYTAPILWGLVEGYGHKSDLDREFSLHLVENPEVK